MAAMSGKARIIFPTIMAFIMSFIVSGLITLINLGPVAHFLWSWMVAWVVAFPCATFAALISQAPARRATEIICGWLDGRSPAA